MLSSVIYGVFSAMLSLPSKFCIIQSHVKFILRCNILFQRHTIFKCIINLEFWPYCQFESCFYWFLSQSSSVRKVWDPKYKEILRGFRGSSDSKESVWSAGDQSLIPGSGRSPGEDSRYWRYPLHYPCLENSTDRGYSPWGPKELGMTEQLTLSLSETIYRTKTINK